MSFRQLEYFVAVAETLNFTKAAKKCFISQTAMTLQIKALEEKIGTPLFLRDKHHVELTAAGRVYLNEAKDILIRSEEAIKLAKTAAEGVYGEITIGFMRGYEQSLFSETLRRFHETYPNISIRLIRDNMSALYGLLENGTCDVAFNLSPYLQTYPELNHYYLKSFPTKAILYPGHPLAGRKVLVYRDLAKEPFIIMQPEGRPNDETEEVMLCYNRGGFVPNIVCREKEVQTLLLMVSSALGISILPEYAVRYYHNAKNLVIIPLVKDLKTKEEELLDFEISWKKDNPNPAIEKLVNWIKTRKIEE
ncbi:MAG: LysR family transcriptional regulator [Eubacteriales bacterium]|nr:LysR family transcriptional regulator [Eubacteriales bacterium]